MKHERYEWLLGYEMGGLVFDGVYYVDHEEGIQKHCQYSFIVLDSDGVITGQELMNYQEFKKHIGQYDLSEVKKITSTKAWKV